MRKRYVVFAVILLSVLAIGVGSLLYLSLGGLSVALEPLRVSYAPFESVALFWIAVEQGFFDSNGLNVTSIEYATGAGALEGLLKGEADIALGTNEFPFTVRALDDEKIKSIASISQSEFIYLVGRRDRGIDIKSDLKGKIIGTTFGTIAQFYLGRFLSVNGVDIQDVDLVDLRTPAEWVDAVLKGSVDAVATAQPYADSARNGLGENSVIWSAQSSQPLFTQVIATEDWISENPDLIQKFLKSLVQAEEFSVTSPFEAKAILKTEMGFTDEYTETVWVQNQFEVSLDQAQILAMEDEARWLIANNLTDSKQVPNFLKYFYFEGLESVKPGSVNIIQ